MPVSRTEDDGKSLCHVDLLRTASSKDKNVVVPTYLSVSTSFYETLVHILVDFLFGRESPFFNLSDMTQMQEVLDLSEAKVEGHFWEAS